MQSPMANLRPTSEGYGSYLRVSAVIGRGKLNISKHCRLMVGHKRQPVISWDLTQPRA
jgi:hypothetical protein